MSNAGLEEVRFRFEFEGTKIVLCEHRDCFVAWWFLSPCHRFEFSEGVLVPEHSDSFSKRHRDQAIMVISRLDNFMYSSLEG